METDEGRLLVRFGVEIDTEPDLEDDLEPDPGLLAEGLREEQR